MLVGDMRLMMELLLTTKSNPPRSIPHIYDYDGSSFLLMDIFLCEVVAGHGGLLELLLTTKSNPPRSIPHIYDYDGLSLWSA